MKHLTKSCFFNLKNISKLRSLVLTAELEITVYALISYCIDYCNSLFTSLRTSALDCLQGIQNAASRLLTRSNRRSPIIPKLKSLHWLPVAYSIQFKILIFMVRLPLMWLKYFTPILQLILFKYQIKYAKFAVCPSHLP